MDFFILKCRVQFNIFSRNFSLSVQLQAAVSVAVLEPSALGLLVEHSTTVPPPLATLRDTLFSECSLYNIYSEHI
jgi:hypothetical protein